MKTQADKEEERRLHKQKKVQKIGQKMLKHYIQYSDDKVSSSSDSEESKSSLRESEISDLV